MMSHGTPTQLGLGAATGVVPKPTGNPCSRAPGRGGGVSISGLHTCSRDVRVLRGGECNKPGEGVERYLLGPRASLPTGKCQCTTMSVDI